MDSDGVLVDKSRKSIDVPKEEILTWYKNMLTGWGYLILSWYLLHDLTASSKCHGRHHVRSATAGSTELLYGMLRTIITSIILKSDLVRYLPVKKESALDPPQP